MQKLTAHYPSSLKMKHSKTTANNSRIVSPSHVYNRNDEQKEANATLTKINDENRKLKEQLNTARLEGDVRNYQLLLKDYQIQLMEKEKEIAFLKSFGSRQFTYGATSVPYPSSLSSFPNSPSFPAAAGVYPPQPSSFFPASSNSIAFPPSDFTCQSHNHLDTQRTCDDYEYSDSDEPVQNSEDQEQALTIEESQNAMMNEPGEVETGNDTKTKKMQATKKRNTEKRKEEGNQPNNNDHDVDINNPQHHELVDYTGTKGRVGIMCRCCETKCPFICSTCSDYFGFSIGICEHCFAQHYETMIAPVNFESFKKHVNVQRKRRNLPLFCFDSTQQNKENS
jgi:hypothetical protein